MVDRKIEEHELGKCSYCTCELRLGNVEWLHRASSCLLQTGCSFSFSCLALNVSVASGANRHKPLEARDLPSKYEYISFCCVKIPQLPFDCFTRRLPQVVKVRMQAKENLGRYKGVADCAFSLLRTEGPLALYTGLESHLWRNAMWSGELQTALRVEELLFDRSVFASKRPPLFNR